jgi:hypothetical protein
LRVGWPLSRPTFYFELSRKVLGAPSPGRLWRAKLRLAYDFAGNAPGDGG